MKKISATFLFLLTVLSLSDSALSKLSKSETELSIEKVLSKASSSIRQSTQVIVVSNHDPSSSNAVINVYEIFDGKWRAVFEPMKGMLGKNGFAAPGEKREGDGKTPSGIFPIGTAFGYNTSVKTKLPYRQSSEKDKWIDDVNSEDYNRWISGETKAASYEKMKRSDNLYKYGFVVEYNTDPVVKGLGSAIFFHVLRAEGKPTAGCVALTEQNILKILEWLDSSRNPKVVMGGEAVLAGI